MGLSVGGTNQAVFQLDVTATGGLQVGGVSQVIRLNPTLLVARTQNSFLTARRTTGRTLVVRRGPGDNVVTRLPSQ
jgi:hypothetical protein